MQQVAPPRVLRRPPCLSPRRSLCRVLAALEPPSSSSPLQPPSRLGGASLPSLQSPPPLPEVLPAPQPVAIEHSSAYALRNLVLPEAADGEPEAGEAEVKLRRGRGDEESVMSWALRRRARTPCSRLSSRACSPPAAELTRSWKRWSVRSRRWLAQPGR